MSELDKAWSNVADITPGDPNEADIHQSLFKGTNQMEEDKMHRLRLRLSALQNRLS